MTGRQYLPGIYLATSTRLSDDQSLGSRHQPQHLDSAAPSATPASVQPIASRQRHAPGAAAAGRLSSSAPLMAARRTPSPAAAQSMGAKAPAPHSQQPPRGYLPELQPQSPSQAQRQQLQPQLDATQQQHGSFNAHTYDVYGQPRAAPPQLPAAHLQVRPPWLAVPWSLSVDSLG